MHRNDSSIAKLVMDRIRREEPWAFSQRDHSFQISLHTARWLTALGILLLTISLLFFAFGLSGKFDAAKEPTSFNINQVIGVGEIGYADSGSTSLSLVVDDMVASIGDAFMIAGNHGSKGLNFPLLISIFIFFEVLLIMNWITRLSK